MTQLKKVDSVEEKKFRQGTEHHVEQRIWDPGVLWLLEAPPSAATGSYFMTLTWESNKWQ